MKKLFTEQAREPYPLSRSRLERFLECPRCFYLQEVEGIERPSIPGFALNMAVDHLLKKEFDIYRADGKPHPLMDSYGIKAVPFQHPKMNEWRNNFKGIRYYHKESNFIIYGAVDDIWKDNDGNLIVVDYKATSTSQVIDMNDKYRQSYKRQMEIYQWLLRKNDFKVSDLGYFVYVNGKKDKDAFDARLEFSVELIPYEGSDQWVENCIFSAKECLIKKEIPASSSDCEYCNYHKHLVEIETKAKLD